MKEARIIIPVECPLNVEEETIESIIHHFGGATVYAAQGHWIQPNEQIISEAVRVVDIAYRPSRDGDNQLFDIAQDFRKKSRQDEVYLRYGNGHVQLVREGCTMDNGELPTAVDVPEFMNLADAVGTLVHENSTVGEKVAALEYAIHSLTKGNRGHHAQFANGSLGGSKAA